VFFILTTASLFVFGLTFCLCSLGCSVSLSFVISTSAVNYLERLVSKMTYYVCRVEPYIWLTFSLTGRQVLVYVIAKHICVA